MCSRQLVLVAFISFHHTVYNRKEIFFWWETFLFYFKMLLSFLPVLSTLHCWKQREQFSLFPSLSPIYPAENVLSWEPSRRTYAHLKLLPANRLSVVNIFTKPPCSFPPHPCYHSTSSSFDGSCSYHGNKKGWRMLPRKSQLEVGCYAGTSCSPSFSVHRENIS